MNESQELKTKAKVKLNEVKAYENSFYEKTKRPSILKERKRIYSKIVKTYVAGGSMKTKIITYPDTSEYKKLHAPPK